MLAHVWFAIALESTTSNFHGAVTVQIFPPTRLAASMFRLCSPRFMCAYWLIYLLTVVFSSLLTATLTALFGLLLIDVV